MSTLTERAQAARLLVAQGELTPEDALRLVVAPTAALEAATPRPRNVTAEEIGRMVALEAQGLNHRQISRQVGRPRSTVSAALARVRQPV
jgi:hypothetical protein